MSNPEMKGARILRFHTSDKVFHSINAICWYALVITGAIVYFGHWMGDISDETANLMMVWHLWLGALFTLNFVGYVLFAPERFAVTLKNLLEWDKNTIMWVQKLRRLSGVVSSRFLSDRLKFRRRVVTTAARR